MTDETREPLPSLIELAFRDWEKAVRPHYAAIGLVAANWSHFEAVIDAWTHKFADLESEVGVCLTAQIAGPARKIHAFIALVKLRGVTDPTAEALDKLAKNITAMAERRNRVAHDWWDMSDPKDPKRIEASARRKLRWEAVPVSTEELNRLAGDIATLQNEFADIASRSFSAWRAP